MLNKSRQTPVDRGMADKILITALNLSGCAAGDDVQGNNSVWDTWIFYGWDGVAAGIRNIPINFIKLQDVEPVLDFYTPVIIANEELISKDPELVRKFLGATARGYKFAVENPEEAAVKTQEEGNGYH
jgi:ABC-type nitrate/sulfonate/bicarbonate transport system substrate-binding protein